MVTKTTPAMGSRHSKTCFAVGYSFKISVPRPMAIMGTMASITPEKVLFE